MKQTFFITHIMVDGWPDIAGEGTRDALDSTNGSVLVIFSFHFLRKNIFLQYDFHIIYGFFEVQIYEYVS